MAPEQSYAQRDTLRVANADNILEIKERLQRRATWEIRIAFGLFLAFIPASWSSFEYLQDWEGFRSRVVEQLSDLEDTDARREAEMAAMRNLLPLIAEIAERSENTEAEVRETKSMVREIQRELLRRRSAE